jgi:hypothetical protein
MGTVSQPIGGHSPAAERKLGKVPHEEKTIVVYVFLAFAAVVQAGRGRPGLASRTRSNEGHFIIVWYPKLVHFWTDFEKQLNHKKKIR